MSDKTFHVTSEDVRKLEAQESKYHGGKTPKDSDVSALKVRLHCNPKATLLSHASNTVFISLTSTRNHSVSNLHN